MSGEAPRIAAALRDFGYDGVTPQEVAEVCAAIRRGERGDQLPHGAVGVLIERLWETAS